MVDVPLSGGMQRSLNILGLLHSWHSAVQRTQNPDRQPYCSSDGCHSRICSMVHSMADMKTCCNSLRPHAFDIHGIGRFVGAWLYVAPSDSGSPVASSQGSQVEVSGLQFVGSREKISLCSIEATVPWQALQCLSPDATQLADPDWQPDARLTPEGAGGHLAGLNASAATNWQAAATAAKQGQMVPLRLMLLDVVSASKDGTDR